MTPFQTFARHLSSALLISALGSATAFAHGGVVNNARAAELGLHRIERLVSLRKLAPIFQDGLTRLKLARLVRAKETDPLFRVIGQVAPVASGPTAEVEILLDAAGKTLQSFVTEGGAAPLPADPLTGVDAVTLAENALHFILDNSETREDLEAFETNLSQLTVTRAATGAEVIISTEQDAKTLKIRLKLTGEVESAEVVDPTPPVAPAESTPVLP